MQETCVAVDVAIFQQITEEEMTKEDKPSIDSLNSVGKTSSLSINPLPEDKILVWSKLKEIADDILKCI